MRAWRFRRVGLLLLVVPCFGFEWPGEVYRIQQALEHEEPAERRELVRKLAQYPAESSKDALLLALEDSDAAVRLEAADVAGRVRLREAVPILLDWIDDKEADTRRAAAAALGRIAEPRALPALLRALGDSSSEVRRAAVGALSRLDAKDAVVPLLGRLDDNDLAVRSDAIVALGALGDASAVVPLLRAAADQAAEVRGAALTALGQLGDPRAVPALSRALADDVEEVRIAAAAALGRLGDAGAVRALKSALERAEPRFAQTILAALGNIDDDGARALLVATLASPTLSQAALRALEWQAQKRAWNFPSPGGAASSSATRGPLLPQLLSSLELALRASNDDAHKAAIADAFAALAAFGPIDTVVPALLALLPTARPELAGAVMHALAASAAPDALLPLLERLAEADPSALDPVLQALRLYFEHAEPDGRAADPLLARLPEVPLPDQRAIVVLLGKVHAARAVPTLIELFAHHDPRLRSAAIAAAGEIGASEAAPALLALLADHDPEIRAAAADALSKTATLEIVRSLLARLHDDRELDRSAALMALGPALTRLSKAGELSAADTKLALDTLASFLPDDDRELADRATDALAVWAPPGALDKIAAGLRLPSSRRRASAVRAIGELDEHGTHEVLRYVLKNGSARESAAAAAALGEVGEVRDVIALVKLAKRLHWPAPGAAAYALSRIAERGGWKPHQAARTLCELGRSREPYVRANVAAALAALGLGACEDNGPDPIRWLEPEHAAVVRAAAARWLYAAASAGHIDAARAEHALEACLQKDVEPSVRAACASPALPREREATSIVARSSDGNRILRDALVGLRLPNGAAFLGYTDANGQLRLKSAARGALVLEDPSLTSLEPLER